MAITDLTGTKWYIPKAACSHLQDFWSSRQYFQLNGSAQGAKIVDGVFVYLGNQISSTNRYVTLDYNGISSSLWFFMSSASWSIAYPCWELVYEGDIYRPNSSSHTSVGAAGIALTITGGSISSLTDSTLIRFLETYATQIIPGYSITYHANGGAPEPANLTEQTNLPSPLPTIAKDGFTFDGWYTDASFTTKAIAGATISANTDLYAKFTETPRKSLTVTYNGSNIIDGAEVEDNVAITYNGATIVTVGEGTKTLKCADKVMKSDLVMGGKTLKCAGKLMASDVEVTVE